MEFTTTELIIQTKNLLTAVRGSLIRVAMNLYRIKSEKAYGDSFGAFCEGELGISESFASKLLTVNKVYLVEGGAVPEDLENIDYERLYLAAKLDAPVEEKIAMARTLTRSEIKTSKAEKDAHKGDFGSYCRLCWLSEETHP